jgi:penicillin-binding protein 1B
MRSVKKTKGRTRVNAARFLRTTPGKVLIALLAFGFVISVGTFAVIYLHYSRLIDAKLRAGPFTQTAKIYAAPRTIALREPMTEDELEGLLRRSGYSESRSNRIGWYHKRPDALEIFPGPEATQQEAGVVKFSDNQISEIVSAEDHTTRTEFPLEPELITSLFDRNRDKRRLVRFDEMPKTLVQAILSAEDKRFFEHSGFDPLRIAKAAYVDLKEGYKKEGASTLSMQLARMFWLDQGKRWERKAAEVMITLQLEHRLTKEQIFEYYANQVDLGRRGTFNIRGIGQAAQVYFGKSVGELNLQECATLGGLIRVQNRYTPFRDPQRMIERRNVVLSMMRQNKFIDDRQYAKAVESPLVLAPGGLESTDAPYFVDLVNDELQSRFQGNDFQSQSYRIYTTLDMNLQRAASDAVRVGMAEVDAQLARQRRFRNKKFPEAQVALIAIDPHTAEIKALIGGRNYGLSQLNRVLAKRQPGSIFKPWVYATAMNTAITPGAPVVLTPLTKLMDEPTTFWFDEKPYEPNNFHDEFHGEVTLREALAKSINIPTVKVAEMVGYDKVVELAKAAGMNLDIQPTPAVALGAYEVTPLEMAGAYTVFSNHGEFVKPNWISLIKAQDNSTFYNYKPETREVLDPRVAYMMVDLLQEVTRSGTAAGIRSRGFLVPAAGKTGTSHDGWFAGFTSELMTIVWVGFDDNSVLDLEGAKSALPIWTEFMKRALTFKEYRDAKPFEAPDGIVTMEIDPASGEPATSACPQRRTEVFIAGTQPLGEVCRLHGGGQPGITHVSGWEQALPAPTTMASTALPARASVAHIPTPPPAKPPEPPAATHEETKPKSLFRKFLGIFK